MIQFDTNPIFKPKGYLEYYFFLEYDEQTGKYKYDEDSGYDSKGFG